MAMATSTPLSAASFSTVESELGTAPVMIVFTPSSLAKAKSFAAELSS